MKRKYITLCLALSSFAAQQAAAADATTEQDYFQEFPIVLSASRLAQPLTEAPNAMTVIDRKMIVASGFRNIADLFKLVPGMYVSYYKGSQPFVSYHGSTDQYARRMQVMIDGRSVYLPPVSTVDWADLPITVDDIERIEVIRGPAAASHGANSTQGVISITTKDAGEMDGKRVSYTRGSKGINDVSARFGKRGDTLDYRMTLAYNADNGYDNLTAAPPGKSITQRQVNTLLNNGYDSNQARLMNFRADYHPNNVDRFDIQFGFNRDVQGVGWWDSANRNPQHDLIANSGFAQLGWIRQLENASELSVRFYHVQQNQKEFFLIGTRQVTQAATINRDEIEVQHTLKLLDTNRLVYGAAYRTDRISAQGDIPALLQTYSSLSNTSEYRVFAHDEWRITPQLLLNSGAMLERDGFGNQNVSPRFALNFHATPQHTFRIGHSVAYRTPSLIEEKYPTNRAILGALIVSAPNVTSPGLTPEKLVSREMGYLGNFPDYATSVDVRLFHDQLSSGIYFAPVLPARSSVFDNGLSAVYQGAEVILKSSFSDTSDLTVNFARESASSNGVALVAASARNAILTSVLPGTPDIMTAMTPRNSASVLYSQKLAHDFSVSGAYYYQGSMQPFDRPSVDFQPTQRRMDVRVAKAFHEGGIKGEISLVMQNLFNKGYTEYVAQNLFNRRGYVTLALDW